MKYVSGWDKSLLRQVSSEGTSKNRAAVRKKLARIRMKLRAGGRLTAEEKEFLKKYAPNLYEEAVAAEREREAYEERLKRCRTKEEAERVKMEKMMEMEAAKEEDAENKMVRMAQTKAAEEDAAPAINRKPSQIEEGKKQRKAEADRKRAEERQNGKISDKQRFDQERLDMERSDRERARRKQEDKYYESEELFREEMEQEERESGVIYRRPAGRQEESGSGKKGESEKAAAAERGNGADVYRPFARGHGAYQAAVSQEDVLREDISQEAVSRELIS